jgi:hypothetical protein
MKKWIAIIVIVLSLLSCNYSSESTDLNGILEFDFGINSEEAKPLLIRNGYKIKIYGDNIIVANKALNGILSGISLMFNQTGLYSGSLEIDNIHFTELNDYDKNEYLKMENRIIKFIEKRYGKTKNIIIDENNILYQKFMNWHFRNGYKIFLGSSYSSRLKSIIVIFRKDE